MVFSSFEFLFAFLPAALAGFWLVSTLKNQTLALGWLIACSLFFYAFWNPAYIALLLGSVFINYSIGKLLLQKTTVQRTWLSIGLLWNIGMLGYYKYANFFLETVTQVTGSSFSTLHIILPLGISFFTFQQIAFLIDVYQQKIQRIDLVDYMLFVCFFPQLIAGPIVHHEQITTQFRRPSSMKLTSKNMAIGLTFLMIGLAKKTIIADSLAPFANSVFAAAESSAIDFYTAWGGTLAYTMQLYFDFSGYIDMAIGIALLFGIRLPINFNSPYKATSIADFWRRWHITLSNFLRDYIYIPLGGNRRGRMRTFCNLFITMAIGGLWHGANWTFVLWGMFHGALLVVHSWWQKRFDIHLPFIAAWLLTFTLVVVSWSLFRAESLAGATHMYQSMLMPDSISLAPYIQEIQNWLAKDIAGIRFPEWIYGMVWLVVATCTALFAPNTTQIMNYWKPTVSSAAMVSVLTVVSLTFLALYQKQDFLYFQF